MSEYSNYLAHHGVKGQRWGVRRYQNKDGTLTEEGRKRFIETSKQTQAENISMLNDVNALREVVKSGKLESDNQKVIDSIKFARRQGHDDDTVRMILSMGLVSLQEAERLHQASIKYEDRMQKYINENANVTIKDISKHGQQLSTEFGFSKKAAKKWEKNRWRSITG